MTAWECSGGTFANLLCALHKLAEDALNLRRHHLGVSLKIIADSRENACLSCFHANSLEVELRSCHWQKLINHIVDEEGCQKNESSPVCLIIPAEQIEEQHGRHHIIGGIIAHVESFAPESA